MINYFLSFLRPYIGKKILLFCLMAIASIGALATPYVLKTIIDDIFPNGSYQELIHILLILVGIYLIRVVASVYIDIIYTKVSKGMISDIRVDVYDKILRKGLNFFRANKSGELVFLLTNDIGNIQNTMSSLVLNIINHLFTITGILIMLFTLNVKLTFISLLTIPLVIISMKKFIPYIKKNFEKVQKEDSKIYNYLVDRINNIRLILSYGTIGFEIKKIRRMHLQLIEVSVKSALFEAFSKNITTFLIAIGPVIVLFFGGKMVFNTTLSIGSLIAFIQYLNKLYNPTISLANSYNDYQKARISMQRIYKHIENINTSNRALDYNELIEQVTLENITFSYEKNPVLKNVNLNFQRGKIYGIIGESGSGKSSIINLLCKLDKPSLGKIKANGKDIYEIGNWTDNIAFVGRENQLFNDSIKNNILYGSPKYRHKLLKKVIIDAHLPEVITNTKEGMDTTVSNSATVISDGQKQRISIARAFLKYPSIILFDEAMSALDTNLEKKIFDNIKRDYKNAIVIIVTHKLNLINEFDHVFEVCQGKVNEINKAIIKKEYQIN